MTSRVDPLLGNDCHGLIPISPHQIPFKNQDRNAPVQCNSSSIHPIDRTPIKNWKPGMRKWKCNHSGTRNGVKRYSCHNIVDDEKALRLGIGSCLRCRQYFLKGRKKNWDTIMVNGARRADKIRLKKGKFTAIDWSLFITKNHMREVYKACRKKCWWCGIKVREFERDHAEGLTVDRLTDGPHYQTDCAIACLKCNRISWRKKFDNIPWWARQEPGESPQLVFKKWWAQYNQYKMVLGSILNPPKLHPPNYRNFQPRCSSFVC